MKVKEFTHKEYNELGDYVDLEGSEVGGYLLQLLCLWDVPESHGKNKELQKAIDLELLYWLNRFRNEAKIIETIEPQPDRITKELEWL